MKTILIRYYDAVQAKADGKPMTLTDKVIMLRSALVHMEIQFDSNRQFVSYSSTMAEGANGSRFMHILYSHPKRWRTIDLEITDIEENILWHVCCSAADLEAGWQTPKNSFAGTVYQGPNHKKYDAIGLLSFALEKSDVWWKNALRMYIWGWTCFIKPDPYKMWCSEACLKALNAAGITNILPTEIDPEDAYNQLTGKEIL